MCLLGVISSNDCTGKSRGNQHGEERALFFWTGFTLELNWLFFKGSLVRGLKFWSHFSPFKFQSGSNTFQFGPHNWVNLAPKIGAKNSPISMGPNWPQASTKLDPLALAPFFGPNPLFSFTVCLEGLPLLLKENTNKIQQTQCTSLICYLCKDHKGQFFSAI